VTERAAHPLPEASVPSILIRSATILTMNDRLDVIHGDVLVRDGLIEAVGAVADGTFDRIIDARGGILLPGFVHLCQTLFRGYADDMSLLDWLRKRVWPMEAAHTPATLKASTRLGAAELLLSGTTTVLTMETVHDTDVVFEALADIGMRATIGKCMMDSAGDDVPKRLREETQASVEESMALARRWNGAADGRLRAAFAPRFAISCSRDLLEAVAALSGTERLLVTHACVREPRRSGSGAAVIRRLLEPGVPRRHRTGHTATVRGALRVGHRGRAGRPRDR
jgi:5-methylthioadenosine/S-adenosylhomocysteine deaminase